MTPDGAPTTRMTGPGVATAAGAVACVVVSLATGVEELGIAGVCLGVLLAASLVMVRLSGADLDLVRAIRPRRVTVGDRCTVELRVHNGRSFLRVPLEVRDSLDGTMIAALTLPQRRTDPACVAAYDLPAKRRGIARFGPLEIRVVDPFGLVRTEVAVPDVVDVIMLPRIVALGIAGATGADDPSGGHRHKRRLTTVSEEFESLREYVPGDDVRRVHWASTARLGRPMVRNHQQPSQRRTTIVLDDRADTYPPSRGPEPFERAVSAAASALAACRDRGDMVRLVTTSGTDSDFFDDQQRFDWALDQLAAITTSATGSLAGALGSANGTVAGDRVIACVGDLDEHAQAALARCAAVGGDVVVVCCGAPVAPDPLRRMLVVTYGSGDVLDRQWQVAMAHRGTAVVT